MRWIALGFLAACKVKEPPPITNEPFHDAFDRRQLGIDYWRSGPGYHLENAALSAHGAHNHPLWLRRKIPHDVRIEFDCWSTEERGDIKVEVFGDGRSFDPDGGAYTATGYEVIFGGWYNSKSIIARMDEHGPNQVGRQDRKVVPSQHYHWKIERSGKSLKWFMDNALFLTYDDPQPLEGPGHEYFAFNNWETDTWFQNLVITPL